MAARGPRAWARRPKETGLMKRTALLLSVLALVGLAGPGRARGQAVRLHDRSEHLLPPGGTIRGRDQEREVPRRPPGQGPRHGQPLRRPAAGRLQERRLPVPPRFSGNQDGHCPARPDHRGPDKGLPQTTQIPPDRSTVAPIALPNGPTAHSLPFLPPRVSSFALRLYPTAGLPWRASSTFRTAWPRASGPNGLLSRSTPSARTPCWAMASAV